MATTSVTEEQASFQEIAFDDGGPKATFRPVDWTLEDIRTVIPAKCFERDTTRSMLYVARDVLMAVIAWKLASHIDSLTTPSEWSTTALRWSLWVVYWSLQSVIFTGLWVLAHECGHRGFSSNEGLCDIVGYVLHTAFLTPYFSWKISHHRHHMSAASMERDELWIPRLKSELNMLTSGEGPLDYEDYLGDTPLYTLVSLIVQQIVGFPLYLMVNTSGQKNWPGLTSHFNPNCTIFKPSQRRAVILSDIGVLATALVLRQASAQLGVAAVVKLYGVPWILLSHWLVCITYLQHTDARLPHYRGKAWTFCRGAASTMDRDFLGWVGRFFMHDISHYHVIHHFFPKIPFYNCEEATERLKAFMGEQYQYSDKPVFKALWESYNECQFVDDDGSVVFYRNRHGQSKVAAVPDTPGTE